MVDLYIIELQEPIGEGSKNEYAPKNILFSWAPSVCPKNTVYFSQNPIYNEDGLILSSPIYHC